MIEVPAEPIGAPSSAWRRCVGTGRMNLSLRNGHDEALRLARAEIGFEMIRGHAMLSDDMGVHRPNEWRGERGGPARLRLPGPGAGRHGLVRKPTYHLYAFMARQGADALARGADHLVTRHPDGHLAVLAWHPVDGSPTTPSDGHRVRRAVARA